MVPALSQEGDKKINLPTGGGKRFLALSFYVEHENSRNIYLDFCLPPPQPTQIFYGVDENEPVLGAA